MTSIRFRLLFSLIGMFLLAWFSVVVVTYVVTRQRIEELFDAHLEHDASILLALAKLDIQKKNVNFPDLAKIEMGYRQNGKVFAFQVWKDHEMLFHSERDFNFEIPSKVGYRNANNQYIEWRLLTVNDPQNRIWVQVGEPHPERDMLIYEIVRDALYPLVLGIPILAVTVWFGVGRGLRPLAEIAGQVAQRSPSFLHPLNPRRVPKEIKFLIEKLNELLSLLKDAFDRERQFTADASHEIRTPLAGIKTHAQLALTAGDEIQRHRALHQIISGVDRTTRLVEQLLTLARLDRESLSEDFHDVDLVDICKDVFASLAFLAQNRNINLTLDAGSVGVVRGSPLAIKILLRNLVNNGICYTPPGGFVEVGIRETGQGIGLSVKDNGPGIPEEERLRVFDRFYRGHPNESPGCGLGLSIVKRIVDLHGARIDLQDNQDQQGLRIRILFPTGV